VPVPGIAFSPLFDTLAILRPAEVVLVVRFLHPAALTFRFALSATGNFWTVTLTMQIASIRQIELLAMLALPPPRALHRQTQGFELPLLQAPPRDRRKLAPATGRTRNRTEQKEEKFLLEPLKKILPSQYPFLKPVSLPDY
jgi:hypothetical protein